MKTRKNDLVEIIHSGATGIVEGPGKAEDFWSIRMLSGKNAGQVLDYKKSTFRLIHPTRNEIFKNNQ